MLVLTMVKKALKIHFILNPALIPNSARDSIEGKREKVQPH